MISEQECIKILNQGERKYNKEEVKVLRDLLIKLALMEYENFKNTREEK